MAQEEKSFGVFKPVGHLVVSFPGAASAAATALALKDAGVADGDIRLYTDRQMIDQIDQDLVHASPLSQLGQELNLVRAHRALAEQGYHFLVLRVSDSVPAQTLADMARDHGALRAQLYGTFIIEELIEHDEQERQVGESPDRGLDAQTPSGLESEAGTQHRQRVEDEKEPQSGSA